MNYDTLTLNNVDEIGIFHGTDNKFHTFDLDSVKQVFTFCLEDCKNLDVFTNREVGKNFRGLLRFNWNGGYLKNLINEKDFYSCEPPQSKYHDNYTSFDINDYRKSFLEDKTLEDRSEHLVFKCPCEKNVVSALSDNKVKCWEPICALDFLNIYFEKGSEDYEQLSELIQSKKLEILRNRYNRVVYCQTRGCKKGEGLVLSKYFRGGEISCPECMESWCYDCGLRPYHKNLSCEQAKNLDKKGFYEVTDEEKETLRYILENTVLCPKCEQAIQKEAGCDHMECSCGTEFCWVCLKTFSNWRKHVKGYKTIGEYVCRRTRKSDRSKLLKYTRAKMIIKIFGTKFDIEDVEEFYDKVGSYDTTNYDSMTSDSDCESIDTSSDSDSDSFYDSSRSSDSDSNSDSDSW